MARRSWTRDDEPRRSQARPVWIALDLHKSRSNLLKIRQAARDLAYGHQSVRSSRRRTETSGNSRQRLEVGGRVQVRIRLFMGSDTMKQSVFWKNKN